MNGEVNCILQVCCPADSAQKAFSKALQKDTGLDAEYCDVAAAWVFTHFDLAERGTLQPFKDSIVRVYNTHQL